MARVEPSGSEPDSEDELDPGLHESFRTAIHAYGIPAPTGISGHEIVCYGWADNVDSALTNLTEKYSYAKMNYGWGKGFNGWLGVRDRNDGDGEGLTEDGMVFPMENSAFIPFQCGQIVGLPIQGPLPASIGWYESPYWQTQKAQTSLCTEPTARTLRVATFGGDITTRDSGGGGGQRPQLVAGDGRRGVPPNLRGSPRSEGGRAVARALRRREHG